VQAKDEAFGRNPVSPPDDAPVPDHLFAQNFIRNDSWLLPDNRSEIQAYEIAAGDCGDGYLSPAVGMAPGVEDFPGTWVAAEPPPLPEDWVAQQVLELPQPFSFSGEDWLKQKLAPPQPNQAFCGFEHAGEGFQETVPLQEAIPTAPVRAPRNSPKDSFGDMLLIDTEFIDRHGGSSHLPAPRQQGQGPRRDEVDTPFVPTRVIAATSEGE
ncbi:MAG: hypothetical protein O3C21_15755, partial [Verrucomicrobia bacterium]|nr:hypothetical protein [Verrucomicrobiota bacterium]